MTDVLFAELMKEAITINQAKDVLFQEMVDGKISEVEFGRKVLQMMNEQLWLPVSAVQKWKEGVVDDLKANLCVSTDNSVPFSWRLCGVKGAKKCKNCRAVDEVLGVKP